MAGNNDGADKSPPKPGSGAGRAGASPDAAVSQSKKPSALIDLKATEVEVREVKKDQQPATAASSTPIVAGAKPLTPPAADPYSKPAKPAAASAADYIAPAQPASARPTAKSDAPSYATDSKPQQAPNAARSTAQSPPPPSRSPADGLRGAATHLAAGLAGGLLALLGADALAPGFGLQHNQPAGLSDDVGRRLQALEASTTSRSQALTGDLAQKLAATEARLSRLDDLANSVKTVADQQSQLQLDTKALGDKLAQPADGGAEARLAKLEDALNTLSAAAATDPQRGRIPQLAAITGRLQEVETSLGNQVATLRKSLTQELDTRIARTTDASEATRVSQQRIDRELATVKAETGQLSERFDSVKSVTERTEIGVRNLKDETGELKTALDTIKGDLTRELKQVARPTDVHTAVAPVASRLAALEDNVQGVVKGEDDRRANAERIVLALELGNLKRTIERGAPFAAELAEVRRVGGPKLDLAALDRLKDRGVPTVPELTREFRGLAHAIIEADAEPANASWQDRLLAGAKSIVRVRRVDQGADDSSVEATVARIESDLKDGKLAEVAATTAKLPAKALAPARGWLDKIEARATVERALTDIERELKASLGGRAPNGSTPGGSIGTGQKG